MPAPTRVIVAAPDYLFDESESWSISSIRSVVKSEEVMSVAPLKGTNADLMSRSLTKMLGDSVTTSKTSTASNQTGSRTGSRTGTTGQDATGQAQFDPQRQQQMDMFNALRGMGGGGRIPGRGWPWRGWWLPPRGSTAAARESSATPPRPPPRGSHHPRHGHPRPGSAAATHARRALNMVHLLLRWGSNWPGRLASCPVVPVREPVREPV